MLARILLFLFWLFFLFLLPTAAPFFFALERGERPQPVFNRRKPRAGYGFNDFLGRLVTRRSFVNRYMSVGVDDDTGLTIFLVDFALVQSSRCIAARHTTARTMIDRVPALDRACL